ncbi:MAG: hypothetical protein NWT08_08490 [Akkermansiaceae bacterium]|jgi:hypothetical protein|nr:hypothetical protein [Akkermansiaceae bacterium]MDP4647982.1 hypothetical protein [Akkermansiaceae bacterium]MDP4781329.1 hypothetical protein [Akkermansiaceae bacterium]MDP4846084.1 hypothetical protein [Akkermansiaceae bacterium]MDP4897577.1 hypothetical protein [Akkermansiaceae bacterium]
MPAATTESNEVSQKSPFAGCAILIAAVAVMLFLIIFSVTVLFRQYNEIAKFTAEEPEPLAIENLENRESELNALAEKLEAFRQSVTDGETAALELNADEINLAIAAYEPFKDLRGTFRVSEITPEALRAKISFQLNGKPRLAKEGETGWMASDPRYLNATMITVPGLLQKEVILQIRHILVEGAEVAPQFEEQMSPYRIAERYIGTEGIGTVMEQLTTVELDEGVIRFVKTKGEVPADTVTNEQVDVASKRFFTFFGIAACIFLLFAGTVIFVSLHLKKSRDVGVSES